MMRILEFADMINRHDFVDTIVQFADPKEFRVDVCLRTTSSNVSKPKFPAGTRVRVLEGLSRTDIPKTAWRLARLLKEWEIDILHTQHYDQALIGWLATRMTPSTRFVFGRHYSDLVRILPGVKRRIYLGTEQVMNKSARRIIVPSSFIFDILTNQQNVPPDKIDVIPYGFVPEKFASVTNEQKEAARKEFIPDGRFVITAAGKLTDQKGVIFLTDAVLALKETIPNILMIFIGEGPEKRYIEKVAEASGMRKNFVVTGWRTDAMAIMSNADIVVQPSLSEAFSQVMGEAMFLSKPLVATEVSGATDIIKNGENGLLVRKADAKALADAILVLYSDQDKRRRLAAEGRRYVEKELSMKNIIKLYETSFRKAMES